MSRTCPGNSVEISWKFPRHFQDISWKFPGNFLDISWTFPGHFPEVSWTFPGIFPDISRNFRGIFLNISWTFPGHFLDISLRFFQVFFRKYFDRSGNIQNIYRNHVIISLDSWWKGTISSRCFRRKQLKHTNDELGQTREKKAQTSGNRHMTVSKNSGPILRKKRPPNEKHLYTTVTL